jgi:hypothetical protein
MSNTKCKSCGTVCKSLNALSKHQDNCKYFQQAKAWKQYIKENEGKDFYYVLVGHKGSDKFIIEKCILGTSTEMVRPYKSNGELEIFQHGINKENLFDNEKDAEERLNYLDNLYHKTFKHKPYISEKTLIQYLNELIYIEIEIANQLNDFENFGGIDFCDVSANGIQIRGHHKQIKRYTYGTQPTIKYDFSNYKECVDEFVEMWKLYDIPDRIRAEQRFIADGEKYGWD